MPKDEDYLRMARESLERAKQRQDQPRDVPDELVDRHQRRLEAQAREAAQRAAESTERSTGESDGQVSNLLPEMPPEWAELQRKAFWAAVCGLTAPFFPLFAVPALVYGVTLVEVNDAPTSWKLKGWLGILGGGFAVLAWGAIILKRVGALPS